MKKITLTLAAIASTLTISAQVANTAQSHQTFEDKLMQNIDHRFSEPSTPRFIFVDRQMKYALGMGGSVRLTSSFGFGKIIPQTPAYSFIPAHIRTGDIPLAKSQYLMSANTSQIFFKLVGHNPILKDFTTFVSMNFTGGESGKEPQLRQAYVTFRGITAGRAWSAFNDLAAVPPTIDFQGPNGASELLNYQIRYTLDLGHRWRLAASAEMPSISATYGEYNTELDQSIPDFIIYGQYQWNNGKNHIRLSGLIRNMNYHDDEADKNRINTGWAAQLSGLANITPSLTAFWQATYGEGFGSYINDLSMLDLDMVPNNNTQGKMQSLEAWAGYAGLKMEFSPRVFCSVTYSQAKVYSKDSFFIENMYKTGQYIAGNVFWNLTENCHIGAEYLLGKRTNMNNEDRSANRVNLLVQYNF
ncbi:MAG: porin [Rikenellaceae bacterium]|nr:porin [Rikenellaceae bacterium]